MFFYPYENIISNREVLARQAEGVEDSVRASHRKMMPCKPGALKHAIWFRDTPGYQRRPAVKQERRLT
jgi:hypothetical protein